jgi:hypothetical protein
MSDQFGPSHSARHLVTSSLSSVLLICAKDLFVEAKAPTGPGTKSFEIDQNFEPGARNRRPTAGGRGPGSIMSDEFDSLDAFEKAAR